MPIYSATWEGSRENKILSILHQTESVNQKWPNPVEAKILLTGKDIFLVAWYLAE